MGSHGTGNGRVDARRWTAVIAVVVAAAALRFAGLDYALPHVSEPDPILIQQAICIERGDGETPSMYPLFLSRLLAWLPGEMAPARVDGGELGDYLEAAARPHVLARRLIALLALISIPATFLFASKFVSFGPAMLASALTATSLLHVVFSRQARPHGAVGALMLLGVIAAMWLVRSGRAASILTAGVTAALAVATLHSGAAILPALLVAVVLHLRRRSDRGRVACLLALPAIMAATIVVSYPFAFKDDGVFAGRTLLSAASFDGGGLPRITRYLWSYDPVLLIGAVAGVLVFSISIMRSRRDPSSRGVSSVDELLVAAAFAVPYLIAIAVYRHSWQRFLLPVLPIFATMTAYAVATITARFGRWRSHALLVVSMSLLAYPTWRAVGYVGAQCRPDPAELAAAWVLDHADPRRDKVAVGATVSLPLLCDQKTLRDSPFYLDDPLRGLLRRVAEYPPHRLTYRMPRMIVPRGRRKDRDMLLDLTQGRAFLDRERPAFAVVSVPSGQLARRDRGRDAVRAGGGELVVVFDGTERISRFGGNVGASTIEIYRLDRANSDVKRR